MTKGERRRKGINRLYFRFLDFTKDIIVSFKKCKKNSLW